MRDYTSFYCYPLIQMFLQKTKRVWIVIHTQILFEISILFYTWQMRRAATRVSSRRAATRACPYCLIKVKWPV
jgi:hypothetical protein